MKNILKVIFVLIFIAMGVLAAIATQVQMHFGAKVVTAENSLTSAESARDIYLKNCARCHGADGKAQTEIGLREDATDLTQIKPSLSKAVRVITNGKDSMPAFGKKLTKAQINSLAKYVRAL